MTDTAIPQQAYPGVPQKPLAGVQPPARRDWNGRISPFHDPCQWLYENKHAFVVFDKFPLTPGHCLVVPKRETAALGELLPEEVVACFDLAETVKIWLASEPEVTGFTIGINQGVTAGQTIRQLHIHVIPRRQGDVPDPTGGIRHMFPGDGNYLKRAAAES